MWQWIKKHPQRTAGIALSVIGGVQTNLALFTNFLSPLANAVITTIFGILVTILAWVKTNTTDSQVNQ